MTGIATEAKKSQVRRPTVGRAMHYYPGEQHKLYDRGPLHATVAMVHGSNRVNLCVLDPNGDPFSVIGVPVVDAATDDGKDYCVWPPMTVTPIPEDEVAAEVAEPEDAEPEADKPETDDSPPEPPSEPPADEQPELNSGDEPESEPEGEETPEPEAEATEEPKPEEPAAAANEPEQKPNEPSAETEEPAAEPEQPAETPPA